MRPAVADDRKLLTPGQVADMLAVDVRTVRRWKAEGRLKAVVIGTRYVRFRAKDVEAMIERAGR